MNEKKNNDLHKKIYVHYLQLIILTNMKNIVKKEL